MVWRSDWRSLVSGAFWWAEQLPVSHVAARAHPVAATPDALFALLIDVEHYPQWRDGVTATHRLPSVDGRTRFVEVSGGDSLTFEILDATAPGDLSRASSAKGFRSEENGSSTWIRANRAG